VVIAARGDAVEMLEEKLAQSIHLRQALPSKGITPAIQEGEHTGARLVRPEPIPSFDRRCDRCSAARTSRLSGRGDQ
jgi:hypothetical protein